MNKRSYTFLSVLLLLWFLSGCQKSSTPTKTANQQSAAQQAAPGETPGQAQQTISDNLPVDPTQASNQTTMPKPSAAVSPASIVVPAGTPITVRLQQGLSSSTAAPGQHFEAVLEQPLVSGDRVVVPAGTPVEGHVVAAHRSGRLRHPGKLALTLDSIIVNERAVPVATTEVVAHGGSHKKRNWGWIGGGTGGGAVIGALAAGGTGALIGSGVGAAAGTTTAFFTGKKDVRFGRERTLRFRLQRETTLS
jgi:hypothetical protein